MSMTPASMTTASMTTALPQPSALGDSSLLSASLLSASPHSAGLPTADPLSMLDEFWCSDCLAPALFERMDAGERSRRAGCEWACTACGAAYFDAIDLIDVVSGDRMAG